MTSPLPSHGPPAASRAGAAAVIAALSVVVALAIAAIQQRPLGDDPFAMLLAGSLLAAAGGWLGTAGPLATGVAAMVGFPAWAAADLWRHGGHSLLPFEFGLYAVYALAGAAVAWCTSHGRRSRPGG